MYMKRCTANASFTSNSKLDFPFGFAKQTMKSNGRVLLMSIVLVLIYCIQRLFALEISLLNILPKYVSGNFQTPETNTTVHIAANLFILGAQKAGTSSLFAMLKKHTCICSGHKEPHFFHYDHEYKKGKAFYEQYFLAHRNEVRKCAKKISEGYSIKDGHYFVDGSTMLHNMHSVAPRIKEFYGSNSSLLKFIILLREPVARDYSCYQHYARNAIGHLPSRFPQYALPFVALEKHKTIKTMAELYDSNLTAKVSMQANNKLAEFVARDEIDFIRGEYVLQIQEFLKYFNRSQLMILNSDYILQNTRSVMKSIAQFLDLKVAPAWNSAVYPHSDHSVKNKCVNDHVPQLDCKFRNKLAAYYAPLNDELMQLFNSSLGLIPRSEPVFSPFNSSYQLLKCSNDSRAAINKVLLADVKESC